MKRKKIYFSTMKALKIEMNIPNVLRQKFKRVSLNETPEFPFFWVYAFA